MADIASMSGDLRGAVQAGSRIRLQDGRHATVSRAFPDPATDRGARAAAFRILLDDGTVAAISPKDIAAVLIEA